MQIGACVSVEQVARSFLTLQSNPMKQLQFLGLPNRQSRQLLTLGPKWRGPTLFLLTLDVFDSSGSFIRFYIEHSMCWLAPINVDSFDQVLDHSQGILPPTLQSADVHHLLSVSALVFALHCAQQSRLQNGGNHSSVTEPVNRPIHSNGKLLNLSYLSGPCLLRGWCLLKSRLLKIQNYLIVGKEESYWK